MTVTVPTLVLVIPFALIIGLGCAWAVRTLADRIVMPWILRRYNRRLVVLLAERHSEETDDGE